MASYEKQQIRGTQISGSGGSVSLPPEILVCMDCGATVWPTRQALHDRWHQTIADMARLTRQTARATTDLYNQPKTQRRNR